MSDKPLDLYMPDYGNEVTHYFAAGQIEADWARRNFPGLAVVVKPIIPGDTLYGIPVHVDPTMPPNTFRLIPRRR